MSPDSIFPDDHTGRNIADGLKQAMAACDLKEENHVCITTNNATIVKLSAELNWLDKAAVLWAQTLLGHR